MKIWIGCDHAGFDRKQEVVALLRERGLEVEDCGCNGERADYPVIAKAVGTAVASHPEDMGILICGTGIGMSIAANKIRGVRAALCADAFSTKQFSRILILSTTKEVKNNLHCFSINKPETAKHFWKHTFRHS